MMITTTAIDQNKEATSHTAEGTIEAVATVKLDEVTGGSWPPPPPWARGWGGRWGGYPGNFYRGAPFMSPRQAARAEWYQAAKAGPFGPWRWW